MDMTCHFNLDGPDERWKMVFSSSNPSIGEYECDVSRPACEEMLINYGQGNCSSTTTPPNSDPLNGYQINLTCSLTESFAGNVCCWVNNDKRCYTFPLPTTSKHACSWDRVKITVCIHAAPPIRTTTPATGIPGIVCWLQYKHQQTITPSDLHAGVIIMIVSCTITYIHQRDCGCCY